MFNEEVASGVRVYICFEVFNFFSNSCDGSKRVSLVRVHANLNPNQIGSRHGFSHTHTLGFGSGQQIVPFFSAFLL